MEASKLSDNELKTYYNTFSSRWKLFSKYVDEGPKNQSYWSRLVDDASHLYESAPSRLMKNIINATLKELEEIATRQCR